MRSDWMNCWSHDSCTKLMLVISTYKGFSSFLVTLSDQQHTFVFFFPLSSQNIILSVSHWGFAQSHIQQKWFKCGARPKVQVVIEHFGFETANPLCFGLQNCSAQACVASCLCTISLDQPILQHWFAPLRHSWPFQPITGFVFSRDVTGRR